jgi:hypothetical protein
VLVPFAPLAESLREFDTAPVFTPFVEHNEMGTGFQCRLDARAFIASAHRAVDAVGTGIEVTEVEFVAALQAPCVVGAQLADPGRRAAAHAQHVHHHGRRPLSLARFDFDGRALLPEFFELVEGAGLGLHDVHHHAAEIDQHPLAFAFAFDADAGMAEFARGFHDAMGERPHLSR